MVGFSYLLTLEVAFSLWFFFLFFKLQCLIGSMLGFFITKGPGVKWTAYSFSAAQEAGACLTLGAWALFTARNGTSNNSFKAALDADALEPNAREEPITRRIDSFWTARRRISLDIPERPDGNVPRICGAFCGLFSWRVCRFNMADYQRRYPLYQSLVFTTKFLSHNTWNSRL